MAAKPEAPLPKSMAGASLISEVIIKKYEHHLPWYRQSKIFLQQGMDIPANTGIGLCKLVKYCSRHEEGAEKKRHKCIAG